MSLLDLLYKLATDGPVTVISLVALVVVYEALRIVRRREDDK